jgi:hypothetical protein
MTEELNDRASLLEEITSLRADNQRLTEEIKKAYVSLDQTRIDVLRAIIETQKHAAFGAHPTIKLLNDIYIRLKSDTNDAAAARSFQRTIHLGPAL